MLTYLTILFFIFYIMLINKISRELQLKKYEKVETISYWFVVLGLIIFSGIRFDIGWDYMAYYETIVTNVQTNIILNGELLSILLIYIAKWLDNYQIYFLINSFITISLIGITIRKYSNNSWVSLLLFITFPLFFLNSLSIIRFFTAIAITFFAFQYLQKGKYIKYIVSVIIASLFHKTALIAIFFIFLKKINLKRFQILILILSIPVIKIVFVVLVQEFFSGYSIYLQSDGLDGMQYLIFMLGIAFMIIVYKEKLEFEDSKMKLANNLFLFGTMIYLMFVENGVLGHRLSLFGTLYMLIVVPKIISLFKGIERFLLTALILVFCIVMFLYTIFSGGEAFFPYKTVFS